MTKNQTGEFAFDIGDVVFSLDYQAVCLVVKNDTQSSKNTHYECVVIMFQDYIDDNQWIYAERAQLISKLEESSVVL